jgi:hypothetical protein
VTPGAAAVKAGRRSVDGANAGLGSSNSHFGNLTGGGATD